MKTIKIAAVVLLFSTAAAICAWHFGASPDAEETRYPTEWLCAACAARFYLTGSEVDRAMQEGGGVPLVCRHCAKRQAWQAVACSRCGLIHFGPEVPGSTGLCPACFPDAKPAQTVFDHTASKARSASDGDDSSRPRRLPANRN